MGRQGNGKLISAGHKSGTRTAGLLPPRPALKKLLSKPVMKEIKPVAAKKSGSRSKRRKLAKRTAKISPPTKAVPSKKIASSVKVPATRAKLPVKPVKTNDPRPV